MDGVNDLHDHISPEHPSSYQNDPLSSQTLTPDFVDRSHLDRENDILGRQVVNKSRSCYKDRCPEHPSSYQDDPLSSQTPTPDFGDRYFGEISA